MRALLWTVLAASLAMNVYVSLGFDGAAEVLLSVATGVISLASGVALWVTRPRHA